MKKRLSCSALLLTVIGALLFSVTFFVQEYKYPGEDAVVPPIYLYLVLLSLLIALSGWILSAFFRTKDNTSTREYTVELVMLAVGAVLLVAFSFDERYILVSLIGFDLLMSAVFIGMSTVIGRSKNGSEKSLKENMYSAFPYYLHGRVDELLRCIRQIKPASGRENLFTSGAVLDERGRLTEVKNYATLNDGALSAVPRRLNIGYDERLFSDDELLRKMYLCLLSRSYDGHIREEAVRELCAGEQELFIMPYLLEAAADYVRQVEAAVYEGLAGKENSALRIFCENNLELFIKAYSRMQCCYHEYYREAVPLRREFVGFKLFYECLGFKKRYLRLNLRAEREKWNKMWQMYAEGALGREAQVLCEYSASVNGEGHSGYFDNNADRLKDHMAALGEILPDDMYKSLRLAYEAIGSEEEVERCDDADAYFFENEYKLNLQLRGVAHQIDINEKI